ncbi:MAG: alpha/beta hydrolase family protein [Bryobacterales bacterium]|nr:alpha/beta hydrolase family protein [Bryobacteraceae bacterium]MDW8353644.1 alpha/beta hydrolase family protein [Bryobacterales bacterium]
MARRISRRELGLAALGSTALAQSSYTGALDGFETKVDLAAFDPVMFSQRRYQRAPLRLTFRASTRRQAEAWQRRLRDKLVELLGGFPRERAPLAPQTLEVREFAAYRREKFVFTSRPGLMVLGYLLTPKHIPPPYAPVICIPGHGRGVDDIVGIDDKGRDRTDKSGYQRDFAIQVAEHGLAAVAIEPLAFGCRRDPRNKRRGLGHSACQPAAGAALLFGETMIGWRVWDVMRTLDWIETRSELDPRRAGCMGISGGGTATLFAAALEPRIQAAFVSGYLNTFRDSILSLAHCLDNYVPGILNWAEMYDVAGLIAPRALFVESGERDEIFPVEASRASFARVREIYRIFGADERIEQEIFPGGHEFHGKRGLPFLARHLGAA